MSEPIMEFIIKLKPGETSRMECPTGKVAFLPFEGYVKSDLFTGTILPGAADVQTTDASGIRHMCARYMFKGTDCEGKECYLFVDNNGYFEPGSQPSPFRTCPTFLTDSEALAPYLHQARFRTEGHPGDGGPVIKVFDVLKED